MILLPNNETVYREWRRVVVQHAVRGVQVHDARLVATMHVHGIKHILTFNVTDFSRYTEIAAVDPLTA
jgi:predicted nucleic acid-binding protein